MSEDLILPIWAQFWSHSIESRCVGGDSLHVENCERGQSHYKAESYRAAESRRKRGG